MTPEARARFWMAPLVALTALPVACKVLPRDTPIPTTPHAIDQGYVGPSEDVALTGMAITGVPIADGVDGTTQKCRYRAFAQDPTGDAPCGLVLYALGADCSSTGCTCAPLPTSGSLLDPVTTIGDVYDVRGEVSVLGEAADGGAPIRHAVYLSKITKTGSNTFITPVAVSTSTDYGKGGAGYTANESMLVKLSTGSPFPVGKPDTEGSFAAAGGAWISGDYRAAWWEDGGFPTALTKLDSITGVASPLAGGGITPRTSDDFVNPTTN